MIFAYRNVDSPNGDFGLVKQEGDERFVVLNVEEYAALREADARANTAKVAADLMRAERDALRGEVATLRGARSAEDVCEMLCEASCVDVTPERCARIWSLLEHPATTMTTLAVIADERGESYAKVRALLKEARAYVAVMREAAIEEREASGIDIGRADRVTSDLLSRIDALLEGVAR